MIKKLANLCRAWWSDAEKLDAAIKKRKRRADRNWWNVDCGGFHYADYQ